MNKRQKKKWKRWFIKDLYKWVRRNKDEGILYALEKLKEQEHE